MILGRPTKAGKARDNHDVVSNVLAYVHGLIAGQEMVESIQGILAGLADKFKACAAGLAMIGSDGFHRYPEVDSVSRPCWFNADNLLQTLNSSPNPVCHPLPKAKSLVTMVVSSNGPEWILWIEDKPLKDWSQGEMGALQMAGMAIALLLGKTLHPKPRWINQLQIQKQFQRMEVLKEMIRPIAHEYGNVLTGISGFAELALMRPAPANQLQRSYLEEIFEGAKEGTHLTEQLRQFARLRYSVEGTCSTGEVIEKLVRCNSHHQPSENGIRLITDNDLPPVALDSDRLELALSIIFDRISASIPQPEIMEIREKKIELDADNCPDFLGQLQPGSHLLLEIRPIGEGITSCLEWQGIMEDLFYTTNASQRRLGLAFAVSILASARCGIRIKTKEETDGAVEVIMPIRITAAE